MARHPIVACAITGAAAAVTACLLSGCQGCPRFMVTPQSKPIAVGVPVVIDCNPTGADTFDPHFDLAGAFWGSPGGGPPPAGAIPDCYAAGTLTVIDTANGTRTVEYQVNGPVTIPLVLEGPDRSRVARSAPVPPGTSEPAECLAFSGVELDFDHSAWHAAVDAGREATCFDGSTVQLTGPATAVETTTDLLTTPLVPASGTSAVTAGPRPTVLSASDRFAPVPCTPQPGDPIPFGGTTWIPIGGPQAYPPGLAPDCTRDPTMTLLSNGELEIRQMSGTYTLARYTGRVLSRPCG